MKNNLKRIAIILPVIALLLAFLAVPAAADYSPETGWSEPVIVPQYEFPLWMNGDTISVYGYYAYQFPDADDVVSIKPSYSCDLLPRDYEYYMLVTTAGTPFLAECRGLWYDSESGHIMQLMLSNIMGTSGEPFEISTSFDDAIYVMDQYPMPASDELLSVLGEISFDIGVLGGFPVISPTEPIGNVWTGIMTWITSALTSVMGAFYVDGSLTLLGTLACIGVSVGIGFLLIGLLQRFLKLRG